MIVRLLRSVLVVGALAAAGSTYLSSGVSAQQPAPAERVNVLVGFRGQPGAAEEALVRAHGGVVRRTFRIVPAIAASVPAAALNGLRAEPRVSVVEIDGTFTAYDLELDNTWGVKRIGAGDVHPFDTGFGIKVGVIDSGVDCTHPDVGLNCDAGWDFVNNDADPSDDNGHGTHVAGTIAALDNGTGVVGVAPQARIIPLKVLDASGSGSFSNVISALEWAVNHGVQVTNNSYGSSGNPGTLVEAAFNNANTAGILNIAAAGNSGNTSGTGTNTGYPANYASVVSVAATDANDGRGYFSSTGPDVEIAAPGVSINSTKLGGGYVVYSGTSMATPHVVGTAALVLAAGVPDANGNGRINDEVRNVLVNTATDLGSAGRDSWYGYGLVQAAAAVAAAQAGTGLQPPPTPVAKVSAITYALTGRRGKDLAITVAVTNSGGSPIGGAAVTIEVTRNGASLGSASGTTDTQGKVAFKITNAASGTYTTTVTALTAANYSWDGVTPANSYVK